MLLLGAYILAVGYDYVMLFKKNSHLDAAGTLLGNKEHGRVMLDSLKTRPEGSFAFFGNSKAKQIVLLLSNPGATATLLASPLENECEITPTAELIDEALHHARKSSVTLAQTILHTNNTLLTQAFTRALFNKLAILHFMEQVKPPKQIKMPFGLSFTSITKKDDKILGPILEETYIDSLDCPNIHGIRSVQDIIDGHRGIDDSSVQLWSIAELEGKKVGVVLLNSLPKIKCIELAYIGLSPTVRGKNLADACMQHITNQIADTPFSRVTLAVDSKNIPAKKLYLKWNFTKIKQRLTMIKKLS